jgi:hypothetical protein
MGDWSTSTVPTMTGVVTVLSSAAELLANDVSQSQKWTHDFE